MTEASERWDPIRSERIVDRLTKLTKSAEKSSPDLVVWPEAAFPYALDENARNDLEGVYAILQPGVRGPVLAGVMMRAHAGGDYNSVVLVDDGHLSPPYNKMHLLAFGEAVPLRRHLPVVEEDVRAERRTWSRAGRQRAFTVGPIRAAVLNCFEDNLPEAGREAAAVEPEPARQRDERRVVLRQRARASCTCASPRCARSSCGATSCARSTADRRRGSTRRGACARAGPPSWRAL